MGMAASQARFLGLTARKNNVEFEGQQINQQRTTLANQSANYYNDLLGMSVPVPPSVQDYTKTVYSFQDGNLTNNITALIAQSNGEFKVSYVSSWQNDFTPVANGAAVIFKDTTNPDAALYKVGNQTLRELGSIYDTSTSFSDTRFVVNTSTKPASYTLGGVDIKDITFTGESIDGHILNAVKLVIDPNDAENYIWYNTENDEYLNLDEVVVHNFTRGENLKDDVFQFRSRYDSVKDINRIWLYRWYRDTQSRGLGNLLENEENKYTGVMSGQLHDISCDPYLSTLTDEQLEKTLEQEREYLAILNKKYGTNDDEWFVRYIQNTTSGVYEPIFYNKNIVASAQYDENQTGASQSNIPCYKMGSAQETEEVKGVKARLEKDATGRYINITLMPKDDIELTYSLTTSTITDQDAYNDAMNQYEFDKATYDQAIQEINSKIEIVQAEDKNLELRLKQLDTEQDAISTEMDAVQKVIEKNTESSFKTFG